MLLCGQKFFLEFPADFDLKFVRYLSVLFPFPDRFIMTTGNEMGSFPVFGQRYRKS